jgi:hypothetical protein
MHAPNALDTEDPADKVDDMRDLHVNFGEIDSYWASKKGLDRGGTLDMLPVFSAQ